MKRHPAFLLALLALVAIIPAAVATADGAPPGTGWWTSFYVQNAGSQPANIHSVAVQFINPTPTVQAYSAFQPDTNPVATTSTIRLRPSDYRGWTGTWPSGTFSNGLPNDFQGSALFNSNQPLVVIGELANVLSETYGTSGGLAIADYELTAQGSHILYFPAVKQNKNNKSSTLFLQNVGLEWDLYSDDAFVSFYCENGNTYSTTVYNFRPGQMAAITPSSAGVPDGTFCTAKALVQVGSKSRLAGILTEHFHAVTPAPVLQAARAFTYAEVTYNTALYSPVYKKKFPDSGQSGRTTGITVMNVGSATTTITGKFTGVGGTCTRWSNTVAVSNVAPQGYASFLTNTGAANGCLGTAVFTSTNNVPIVGVVHESFLDPVPTSPLTQSATLSDLVPASALTTKALIPVFKEKYQERTSGLTIMNVSGGNATIRAVFKGASGIYTTTDQIVAQNKVLILSWVSDVGSPFPTRPPAGYWYAVTVFSDSSHQIAVALAEATYRNGSYCFGQQVGSPPCWDRAFYTGFNVQP